MRGVAEVIAKGVPRSKTFAKAGMDKRRSWRIAPMWRLVTARARRDVLCWCLFWSALQYVAPLSITLLSR